MITNFFKFIWRFLDVIFFLAAIIFAVWGFFLLSFTAGIFAIAVSLVVLGFLVEQVAAKLS